MLFARACAAKFPRIIFLIPFLPLLTPQAHALEVGTCDTPANLSTKLNAEGHKIVAQMDRVGISLARGGVRHDVGQLVTATPDLKRWYLLGGDEPLSTRSTQMCVVMAGRNLEINDYRKITPPTVTQYKFDTKKALEQCDTLDKEFEGPEDAKIRCNEYYEVLRGLGQTFNERVALQGVTDQNTLMTIIANPDPSNQVVSAGKYNFHTLATASAGATLISGRGINFSFTAWTWGVLNARQSAQP